MNGRYMRAAEIRWHNRHPERLRHIHQKKEKKKVSTVQIFDADLRFVNEIPSIPPVGKTAPPRRNTLWANRLCHQYEIFSLLTSFSHRHKNQCRLYQRIIKDMR